MKSINKLGLGTVQWGIPYGISNRSGIVASDTVTAILTEARKCGIQVLDTASLYGRAETVLGTNSLEFFRVVTKTPKFATSVITDEQAAQLVDTFHQSIQRLRCRRICGLLIHHANDLLAPGGEKLLDAMLELRSNGFVEKIGVSVYDGEQTDAVLKVFKPDIVQLPLSILDQRMLVSGQLERLKKAEIEIHVRSVFLQGLLLMPMSQIPKYFDPISPLLASWHFAAQKLGMTLSQAALSFVRDIPYVDTVLVGVESLAQFKSCVEDFSIGASFDASNFACSDPKFVNPALWKV